jgi:hypothetical protein
MGNLCFDYIFLFALQCYDFSRNSIPFLLCRFVEFDHVKPSPWLLLNSIYWQNSIRVVSKCLTSGCLQEMLKQVKENLAFPNLISLLWIHVKVWIILSLKMQAQMWSKTYNKKVVKVWQSGEHTSFKLWCRCAIDIINGQNNRINSYQ